MEKYSSKIDVILSNENIDWSSIIKTGVQTPLTESQEKDVRNIMIATAKIAAITAIKVLNDEN
ncbi:hypothetical protein [Enterococcus plantarum]|uniref:Uncharacterized protein n=1 Tax=Enterococcus plantarum TaxID=1077675 RepID=A0A2W3Z176_9ENTE|nr:hypothetical protein [Enterococcus plantarum]MBO0423818.1 hypothetical protein [Enterococcus plantarum]PZL71040.1 hypothetical protein CI088_14285 [Enterococcus plantarum]